MREDMAKVLTERPRRHADRKNLSNKIHRSRLKREYEDEETKREGMRARHVRNHGVSAKEFDDHIKPLKRYLYKQVGRPWDKVYSEICARIKLSSTVQRHILTHVEGYVEIKPIFVDGKPHSETYNYAGNLNPLRPGELFVSPKGILTKVRGSDKHWWKSRNRRRQDAPVMDRICVNDMTEYRLVEGQWYFVEYRHIRQDQGVVYDRLLGAQFDTQEKSWYSAAALLSRSHGEAKHGGSPLPLTPVRYVYFKRFAGKQELKKYGVK